MFKPDRVSYGEPGLTCQPMYQLICRSLLDQHSTDTSVGYQPRVDQQPKDKLVKCPPMSADLLTLISSVAYWSTTGQLSVNYRSIISQPPVVYRSTVCLVCQYVGCYINRGVIVTLIASRSSIS